MHTIHRILRSARITMMVAMFGLATTASASAQTVLFSESFDGAWSTCNFDLQTGGQYWTSIGTGDFVRVRAGDLQLTGRVVRLQ